MDHHALQSLFAKLDSHYFGGKLREAHIRVEFGWVDRRRGPEASLLMGDIAGHWQPFLHLIQIDDRISDPLEIEAVLVHEMIHASVELERPLRKNENDHGKRFRRELERIYCEGIGTAHIEDEIAKYPYVP